MYLIYKIQESMKQNIMEHLLPIGSIVTLKGGTKKVMICGRFQEQQATSKLYDYSSCLYPEGFLAADEMYLFQQEDIEQVFYVGMQDEDEFAFRGFLEDKLIEKGYLKKQKN